MRGTEGQDAPVPACQYVCVLVGPRKIGAGNGGRTRDLKLGKLALYQLSYAREYE